jgi:hypothetical protein
VEIDLDDLKPTAVRRLLKQALLCGHKLKRSDMESDEDSKSEKAEDKERDDLADLHEEKGKSRTPKVERDDFHPNDLAESEDEDEDEKPAKKKFPPKGRKAPPFKKKG